MPFKNPEQRRAYYRVYWKTYYAANRRREQLKHKLYLQRHPGKNNAYCHRYQARKHSLPCTATAEQEDAIKAAYKGRCAYCGKKPKQLTIDHVIPLSKHGGHVPENIVPACRTCNSAKGARESPLLPAIRLLL